MNTSWPHPTRADHEQFVLREGWRKVPSTHHETYELALADGRVLRTRISRPPNRTTYGQRMWAHILRDQLDVTTDEFWACARDGVTPTRTTEDGFDNIGATIPVEIVNLLIARVGLSRHAISGITREEAIARLNDFWATGR